MKQLTAKVLLFVMIFNAMLSNFTLSIFAYSNPKATSKTNFTWNKDKTLNDILQEISRDTFSDEVLLIWDINKLNGIENSTGTYTLKYPLADGKYIEFEIKRENDKSTITYKINGDNKVNNKGQDANKKLLVYSEAQKAYVPANINNFPNTDSFTLKNVYQDGNAKDVAFQISENSGAAFKYGNTSIKFLWKDGKMHFVTNGLTRGNIYPFDLEYTTNNNQKEKETKRIFLGIDTGESFIVKPYANETEKGSIVNKTPLGKDIIDQTNRPITEYPGGQEVGVSITFNTPKEWKDGLDPNNPWKDGKYDFIQDTTKTPTELVLNLGHPDNTKKLVVKIDNIYANNGATVTGGQGTVKAEYKYDDANHTGTLILRNLESSTIYNDIFLSLERTDDRTYFETMPTTLPIGRIYTYPAYKVVALGESEYYLEIEPYKGYNGKYIVKQGAQVGTIQDWFTYEDKTEGKSKILVPVPLDLVSKIEKYFKVDFTLLLPTGDESDLEFTSQILHYKPFDTDIKLGTPKNLEIVSSNIVRKDEEQEHLFLTLKWDIDTKTVLENLKSQHKQIPPNFNIDYLFYKGLKPEELEETDFLGVNLDFGDNDITNIKYTLPDKYKNVGISIVEGEDKTFTSTKKEVVGNKQITTVVANVTFKIPVSEKGATDKKVLEYPNIYFLATKGTYTIKPQNGAEDTYTTGLSLPVTLVLNGIERIPVPPPQNLRVIEETVDRTNFSVDYDTLRYKEKEDLLYVYNEIMLKTIGRELKDDSIKYDFYITQEKALFDELVKYSKEEEIPESIKSNINKYENTEAMTAEGINIDVNTLTGSNGLLLDTLRQGKIVQIANIGQDMGIDKQKLNFLGLDENQTYYVVGRTSATPYEMVTKISQKNILEKFNLTNKLAGDLLTEKIDYSKFSHIVTATTKKNDGEPGENEKIPPAPNKFIAEEITLNSVDLVWNLVKDNIPEWQEPKSTLEYQFIKTKGEQLPDTFLKSRESYEKTWQSLSNVKNKAGLRTSKDGEKGIIYEFDAETGKFATTPADPERYEYISWEGEDGRIKDKTLSPNQIYFYYIRTVRVSEKGDEAYSVWVPLTFTTKNTTGPKNLRVEYGAEYDKKSEVVISFDIPKMDLDLIGTEYNLQYSLKEDLGEWSEDKTMPKDKLTFTDNDDGKTMKVTYKITGLKSGTLYTIRVRMLNIPLNAPSIYSNEVEHRTDSDSGDIDYDEDVNNWNKYFKDLVEELKNQPYWFGKDTTTDTLVYYRPQYFDKIIATTNNSIIDLAVGKGGSYKEYYLPASAVISAFDQNKGFKISYNDADVIFNPKTIDPYENDIIKKIAEELESKKEDIKDYFIKLTVDFKNNKYVVNSSNSLSPATTIQVSIVSTKNPIIEWDQDMLDYIDKLLETEEFSKDLKAKIEKLIKNKTENKIMIQELGKVFEEFKLKFANNLTNDLTKLIRKTEHIQFLAGDIVFAYKVPTDIAIDGYKKSNGNWVSVGAKDYLGKKAIFTKETGEYIFVGKKVIINGVGNLPNGNQITNIVIKYGLDDFLGKDGNINLRAPMTRNATIGSLARVGGASKTQDPIEFFKTKGIIISNRNMNNNITSEEAVYLTMKVYEMKSGTKLETVKIRNYNLTKDIKNINNNYKKSIQVAFETGIYNNPNMNGKGTITVQEFLQSLANMSTMLGI